MKSALSNSLWTGIEMCVLVCVTVPVLRIYSLLVDSARICGARISCWRKTLDYQVDPRFSSLHKGVAKSYWIYQEVDKNHTMSSRTG